VSLKEEILAAEARRMKFCRELHEIALKAQEDFSDEGFDCGERGYGLTYEGRISSNYPWLYVEFKTSGALPLEALVETERRIKAHCEAQEYRASYLSTTVGPRLFQCRLIYREDLKK
jgi:hypothetical protein